MNFDFLKDKVEELWSRILDSLPNILMGIFIFIMFYFVANFYKNKITNVNSVQSEVNGETNSFSNNLIYTQLSELVYYAIIIIGILFALSHLGFNLTGLIAIFGVIGFAIGFAMQNSLQNIISGIYIALLNMFELGDYIALQTVSLGLPTYGKVISFNLYFTTIKQIGQQSIIEIPNSLFQSNLISIIKKNIVK